MSTPAVSEAHRAAQRQALLALLCGIWFLLTGWMWTYALCLVIAYPFALAGFFLWRRARQAEPENKRARVAGAFLAVGLLASAVAPFLFK